MSINTKTITLEEFLKIREKLYDNAEDLRKRETGETRNAVKRTEWLYQNFEALYATGTILPDTPDFRGCYHFQRTMTRWNRSAYGKDYQSNLNQHKKLSEDPESVEKLKRMVEINGLSWSRTWRNTKEAIREGRFLSFWKFRLAHDDTKGSWRHWWDSINNDKKFKVGDIVELRANSKRRHVLELRTFNQAGDFLRGLSRPDFMGCYKKAMMVVAYDQQNPDNTYSYKKPQGSCRLVSVLPMGSAKILYVPEQFLKISRKKTIKDAKAKK